MICLKIMILKMYLVAIRKIKKNTTFFSKNRFVIASNKYVKKNIL